MKYRYQYVNDEAFNHKVEIHSDDNRLIVTDLALDQAAKICSELNAISVRLDDANLGSKRYEKLRKLNPREFSDIYGTNLSTGTKFDLLVDEEL